MGNGYEVAGAAGTEVLAFAKYADLERAGDCAAAKIKEGFMEMGYVLKVARDTDILAGSAYASHEEFGEKRYGLDKGTVSRYIRIVERFSVGGDSNVLQEGYKGIGFAKLSLMLHMPDAVAEEIPKSYSKQEVQEIKEEIDAERAVSDIEVAIEAASVPEGEKAGSLLERALRQLGKERQDIYRKLHAAAWDNSPCDEQTLLEVLAPQGDAAYFVRIPGTGRLMLSVSGESASVVNVRSGEKEKYTARDVWFAVLGILHTCDLEASWQQEYGEPMEPAAGSVPKAAGEPAGKAEAAPAQPKEKRKDSKVVKAAPPKKTEKKPARAAAQKACPEPEDGQVSGQMEVAGYQEAIPDVHFEEITGEPPEAENPGSAAYAGAGMGSPSGSPTACLPVGAYGEADASAGEAAATAETCEDAGQAAVEGLLAGENLPGTDGADQLDVAGDDADGSSADRTARKTAWVASYMEAWGELQASEKALSRFVWRNHGGFSVGTKDLEEARSEALGMIVSIGKLIDLITEAYHGGIMQGYVTVTTDGKINHAGQE